MADLGVAWAVADHASSGITCKFHYENDVDKSTSCSSLQFFCWNSRRVKYYAPNYWNHAIWSSVGTKESWISLVIFLQWRQRWTSTFIWTCEIDIQIISKNTISTSIQFHIQITRVFQRYWSLLSFYAQATSKVLCLHHRLMLILVTIFATLLEIRA